MVSTELISVLIGLHLLAIPSPQLTTPRAEYGTWKSSILGGGGYIQDVFPTSKPGVLYASVDVGGVYRSDDGGDRWRMLHAGLPSIGTCGVRGVSVDPRNPDDLVILFGDRWIKGGGLYRSKDGGRTWNQTGLVPTFANDHLRWAGRLIQRDPENPDRIIAFCHLEGMWLSEDNGASFKRLGALVGRLPSDLKVDPLKPNRWYAVAGQYAEKDQFHAYSDKPWNPVGGLFVSEDRGASWTPKFGAGLTEIVFDPRRPNWLYGLWNDESVKMSQDGGSTWVDYNTGLPELAQGKKREYIGAHTYRALAATKMGLLLSNTQGDHFIRAYGSVSWVPVPESSWKETLEGETWFGAFLGNGWKHRGKATASIVIDPFDDFKRYFTDWYGLYFTPNAGRNWILKMDGIEATVIHTIQPDLSSSDGLHMGMADNGYLFSANGGVRFQSGKLNSNMKSIAASFADPKVVYATGDGGTGSWRADTLWTSTNAGKNWKKVPTEGLPVGPDSNYNSVAVDPTNPDRIAVTVSGRIPEEKTKPAQGGVWLSNDGGKTFSAMVDGFPKETELFEGQIFSGSSELGFLPNGQMIAIASKAGKAFLGSPDSKGVLSWKELKGIDGKPRSVSIGNPGAPLVVVGTSEGVYLSRDVNAANGGFRKVYFGDCREVRVDPTNSENIAMSRAGGVAVSKTGGRVWIEVGKDLPDRNSPCLNLRGDRLWVGTKGSGVFWMKI